MTKAILSIEKLAEKVAKGLGGWLMFEHHSHRADLFSEKYLSLGIGNILSGNCRNKVIAEYTHPILKERKAGRPPQIDFVICNKDGLIKLALESKWVGTKNTSSPKMSDILWDIIRLELLNYQYKTEALFVLAGKKSQMDEIFEHTGFVDKTPKGKKRSLLPNRNFRIQLDLIGGSINRLKLLASCLERYKRVEVPSKILISGVHKFPHDCNNFENEVCVWSISTVNNAKRYKYADLCKRISKREDKINRLKATMQE